MVKRFTRVSPRIMVTFAALAALVAGGLFAVTARSSFASPKPGASSSVSSSAVSSRGKLTVKGTVVISKLGSLQSLPAISGKVTPRATVLRARPGAAHSNVATNAHAPNVAGVKSASKGSVLNNFDGVNALQNDSISQPLEPPDEGLAAGGGYVANFVNLTGAFYTTGGATAAGPFSLFSFYGEPTAANLSDPRVFYDASTHTWFANLFEYGGNNNTESHLDIAVNTGNPITGTWTIFTLNTTEAQDSGCPCFPDYDIFGIDQNNIYIDPNEFSLATSAFNGAEIFAISKSQLEGGVSANFVRFGELSQAGAPAYHVQAAITYGSPSAEYFLSSLDPNSTFDNRLGLWAMTNGASVTTGVGSPSLTSTIISSEAYGFPVNALTPVGFNGFTNTATTGVVTPDFDAMQEVEFVNGHLDGALNTSVTINGDTSTRDGVAWFQVTPKLSNGGISSSSKVTHQGYVAASGEYMLYPHINEVKDGGMAITFTMGGPNTYLSADFVTKSAGASNFGAVQIAAGGTGPDNGFTMTSAFGGVGRWGDYSNGEIDYQHNTVWLASEYIPNAGDGIANWGNRVYEVQL